MDLGRVSMSARRGALYHAWHMWSDDEPKILADPVAAVFVDPEERETFAATLEEPQERARRAVVRSVAVLRHRFAEDELALAVEKGVQQYVVLGAGMDTFAFRQPPFAADLRIFEVDQPGTQAWKRARLAAVGIADPPNVRWVPLDFERVTLADGLASAGFDTAQPAFFSWLGVIMYLTWPAAAAVLSFVAALPRPSGIVLDFVPPDDALVGEDREAMRRISADAARGGELLRLRLGSEELVARLHDLGFSQVSLLTPEEATHRYFANRRDGLRVPRYAPLVSASV